MEPSNNSAPLRRNAEEIKKLISDWKKSGLSKKQFCEQNNLKYLTFCSWTCKTKQPKCLEENFIPIKINKTEAGADKFAEIHFKNGNSITLFQSVNADTLKSILRA